MKEFGFIVLNCIYFKHCLSFYSCFIILNEEAQNSGGASLRSFSCDPSFLRKTKRCYNQV